MFNWLIKLLGGYTPKQYKFVRDLHHEKCILLNNALRQLEQARKNDTPRDPKTGRFMKK